MRLLLQWTTVSTMSTKHLLICAGIVYWFATAFGLRADVLVMQNGDRYSGKVLAVSADTVVLNSEILGKINVPRRKVANLAFGTNAAAPQATDVLAPAAVNAPAAAAPPALVLAGTNLDLSAALRQLGANTNFIGQIRQQMFAGNPQAAGRFDEMVNGLFTGQMNLDDLRRQAQSSAAQLRALKRELGPDADDALDGYLKILDAFVNEAPAGPANQPPAP